MRVIFLILLLFAVSCGESKGAPKGGGQVPVKVLKVELQEVPITSEFVGQAKSSRQVEIRARVDGFLEKVAYEEGAVVKEGDILFLLDKRPYEAALQETEGALALQKSRLATASANLKRIRPLAEKDAVSQKDLDDAVGAEDGAKASVLSAEGAYRDAQLKLDYATIRSPLTGLASKTSKQEGSYIPQGQESLLTYVAKLDPIWVTFTISENLVLRYEREIKLGKITPPENDNYQVQILLGDGTLHPYLGRINFTEPNIDPQTGTVLLRAELGNPEGSIRPGQFLRVRLLGAKRKNAIVLPQTAVLQGAKGHFVWVVNNSSKAEVRAVVVGSWIEDKWFIDQGLNPGDIVILDNLMKLVPGAPVAYE